MPVVRCWSRRAGGHCPAGSAVWQGGYTDTKPPRAIQAGQLSGPAPASFTYVNGVATVRNRTRKEAPPEGSPTEPLRLPQEAGIKARSSRNEPGQAQPRNADGIGQMPKALLAIDQQVQSNMHEIWDVSRRDDVPGHSETAIG